MSMPHVAIIATDGFEESELFTPLEALRAAGCQVGILAPGKDDIQGFAHTRPSRSCHVTRLVQEEDPARYDAIVLPGGLFNPDALRTNEAVVGFVKKAVAANKIIAAICHGPQVLISAGCVRGRHMTAVRAIQIDLANAGALVSDEAVVIDGQFVTSRTPADLPSFCRALCDRLGIPLRSNLRSVT
jgi:protease I